MATSEEMDMAITVIAKRIIAEFIPQSPAIGGAYEIAARRFDIANTAFPMLTALGEKIVELTHEECNAAQKDLSQYEREPGIPRYLS